MGKLKLQIAFLALTFVAAVAAKMYVDRYLEKQAVSSEPAEDIPPGTVSLPEAPQPDGRYAAKP